MALGAILLLATAFICTLPTAPAYALQNSATGTANGAALDIGSATVTLRLVGVNAVTSAIAEISPSTVSTNNAGVRFSYDILPTINPADAGIGSIAITAPSGYSNLATTMVLAGGVPLSPNCAAPGAGTYCSTVSGQTISITLGSRVTNNQTTIRIIFSADTPLTTGKGDFTSMVGNALPNLNTTPGNADGNPGNGNTLTVQVVPPAYCNCSQQQQPAGHRDSDKFQFSEGGN